MKKPENLNLNMDTSNTEAALEALGIELVEGKWPGRLEVDEEGKFKEPKTAYFFRSIANGKTTRHPRTMEEVTAWVQKRFEVLRRKNDPVIVKQVRALREEQLKNEAPRMARRNLAPRPTHRTS